MFFVSFLFAAVHHPFSRLIPFFIVGIFWTPFKGFGGGPFGKAASRFPLCGRDALNETREILFASFNHPGPESWALTGVPTGGCWC